VTEAQNEANLNDVIETSEEAHPDHREHGKTPPRPSEAALETRTRHEQETVNETDGDH